MNTKVKKEEKEGLLPMLDQRFSCSSWQRQQQSSCEQMSTLQTRRTHPRAAGWSLKEQQPLDSSCWSSFSWQEQQPTGRAHTGAREKGEEEGRAEKGFGLTAAPNLQQSSVSGVGGQVRREGVKLSQGKRGGDL